MAVGPCLNAIGAFLGLTGFRTRSMLAIGDKVTVLNGNPPCIIACSSRDMVDTASPFSRTHTAFPQDDVLPQSLLGRQSTPANDMFEGEFEITNLFSVGVVFAQNMMMLKGGDRAKVEAVLYNDMVRIISQEFRNHTAMGDEFVYDDGRLGSESSGTTYRNESYGQGVNDDKPLVALKGNQADVSKIDSVNDTGNWRWSQYTGWLGDFIRLFVYDPQTTAANLALGTAYSSGRAHAWVGPDGTILVQSTADIILERVVRVRVPKKLKRHDDPEGDTPDDHDKFDASFLKRWKDADNSRPWEKAYVLREYGRWISQGFAYERFRQSSKDWSVPTLDQVPRPDGAEHQKDVGTANPQLQSSATDGYSNVYATIRIYRDGSIGVQDVAGSTVTMANGNVSIAAVKHMHLEAAGDIRLAAGQNVYVKARRNIELSAVKGGLIMKCRTLLRALCELGSVWIKSDAPDPDNPGYTAASHASDGGSVPDTDPLPEVMSAAVYIQASQGKAEVKSKQRLWLHTQNGTGYNGDDPGDVSASVVINSAQHVVAATLTGNVRLNSHKFIGNFETAVEVDTPKCFFVNTMTFTIGNYMALRNSTLNVSDIKAETLKAVDGISGPLSGPSSDPRLSSAPPTGPYHLNHVRLIDPSIIVDLPNTGGYAGELDDSLSDTGLQPPDPVANTTLWKFFDKSEYLWDADELANGMYVSPSQQTICIKISDNTDYPDFPAFASWIWSEDNLLSAPETDSGSKPWAATIIFNKPSDSQKPMDYVGDPSTVPTTTAGFAKNNMTFYFLPYAN